MAPWQSPSSYRDGRWLVFLIIKKKRSEGNRAQQEEFGTIQAAQLSCEFICLEIGNGVFPSSMPAASALPRICEGHIMISISRSGWSVVDGSHPQSCATLCSQDCTSQGPWPTICKTFTPASPPSPANLLVVSQQPGEAEISDDYTNQSARLALGCLMRKRKCPALTGRIRASKQ